MAKKAWASRWTEDMARATVVKWKSGAPNTAEMSPFGLVDDRADLRGFPYSIPAALEDLTFQMCDLSESDFRHSGIDRCLFEDTVFDRAIMGAVLESANRFIRCTFRKTDFRGAVIGGDGSTYLDCLFEKANFRRTRSIRPDFQSCTFRDCFLTNMDFNAASFENCVFEGRLAGTWFRGGYPNPDDERLFGKAKKNRMLNVSFENATLLGIATSDDCDLSTIKLPRTGDYRLYDRRIERLEWLGTKIVSWPEPARQQAKLFAQIYSNVSEPQDQFIINCDEIRSDWVPDAGQQLIDVLDSFPGSPRPENAQPTT